jgi:hypothetical protein
MERMTITKVLVAQEARLWASAAAWGGRFKPIAYCVGDVDKSTIS